ncbi:MAG: O-methyltransferase [Terriglobales bacterium]
MITEPKVEEYLYGLLPPRNAVLAEMEAEARRRQIPIVGPAVARFFWLLARIHGARRIFELGSAIGYSTIWWAEAVGPEGEVYYTDTSAANAQEAAGYFQRLGMEGRIRQRREDALAALREAPGEFDIIFCDLSKHQYPAALELGMPRLRSGGLFVADNVLWGGKVAAPDASEDTQGILAFNRAIYAQPGWTAAIVPLRDGLAICRKP